MNGKRFPRKSWCQRWAALVLALGWAGSAGAQPGPEAARLNLTPALTVPESKPADNAITDPNVVPAGCSTCSNGLFGGHGGGSNCYGQNCGGCAGCGDGGQCVPGRLNCCSHCEGRTPIGKLLCGLYECICCPDPCYDPCWIPQANAAFFVDGARPVSQMRIRWDAVLNYTLPDRNEFFWARIGGKGPRPTFRDANCNVVPANITLPPYPCPGAMPRTVPAPLFGLRYNDLALYTETAVGLASLFVEIPYRSLDPDEPFDHAGGFADLNLGVKTLIFDCELLQVAIQFRTYVPTGNFTKGLGTGHVSLEPSLLFALKLTPDTYLQGQIAEWIPIGGDQDYQGSILHYHFALDQVLYRILPDVPIIGTLETNFYSFQDGAFTDITGEPFQHSSGETYFSFGPGLRVDVCKRIDFGVAAAFAVGDHGPGQTYRTEFRWRF